MQRQFLELIKTIGFIPKGIQVANEELYNKLHPLTKQLAVEMQLLEELEELTMIKEMIINQAENDEDFFS
ncbi:DUF6930 domain-containing protein [Bacillus kwashiorkori]|uniref:DUF6930 domain-containing protein n=1 Tax=Bacillus kwashiorkori TaxID=1522318 RepID=UPI003B83A38C